MQLSLTRLSSFAAAAAVVAGCASQTSQPSQPSQPAAGGGGKHLVYRDGTGNLIRQFTYPDDSFCRRVEALAGRGARCQAEPAPGFTAQATLRYNPPGVIVQGFYADMARCRADTSVMSAGVQLVDGCAAR